jgi:hypothetical protein
MDAKSSVTTLQLITSSCLYRARRQPIDELNRLDKSRLHPWSNCLTVATLNQQAKQSCAMVDDTNAIKYKINLTSYKIYPMRVLPPRDDNLLFTVHMQKGANFVMGI